MHALVKEEMLPLSAGATGCPSPSLTRTTSGSTPPVGGWLLAGVIGHWRSCWNAGRYHRPEAWWPIGRR